MAESVRRIRVRDLQEKKGRGEKIAMLTVYDATMARLLDRALDTYADTVPGGAHYDLALWHGLGLPLLLSALVLAVGTAAFFGRARLRFRRHVCGRDARTTAGRMPALLITALLQSQ